MMNRTNIIPNLQRIGWLTLVLGSMVIIISAIQQKEGNMVQEVMVKINPLPQGELLVNEGDILLIVERTFGHQIVGLPLASISVDRLEKALEEDPFVLNADVFIDAQDQVHIELDQRQPFIRIMDNNGLNYYMDRYGVKMPLSKHVAARVLVATGNLPPYITDFREQEGNTLASIFELGTRIREDPFLQTMIEQIHVDESGKVGLVPKIGDQKIKLGLPTDLEDKLQRLKVFYEEIVPYQGWQKYKTVSLEFAGQLVCKK